MTWTKSGTIAVTNGSTAVVGTGTTWISTAAAGEGLVGPDGKIYEIASINSDLSLTLSSPYLGSTQAGQAYSILPTQAYIQSLASQVSALISNYASVKDNAGAGKFPAGTQSVPGIRFAADDNTGLRSTGPDAMALVAGGVDRLLVDAAGIHGAMTNSTVDATPIGQTTAAAGSFTTLSTTGAANFDALVSSEYFFNKGGSGSSGALLSTTENQLWAAGVKKVTIGANDVAVAGALSATGAISSSTGSGGIALSGDTGPDTGYLGYNYKNANGTETVVVSNRPSWRIAFSNGASDAAVFGRRAANAAVGVWVEQMRLDANGNLLVGAMSGSTHKIVKAAGSNDYGLMLENGGSTNPYGIMIHHTAADNSGGAFIACADLGGAKMLIAGNGNVQNVNNSYGAISDLKLKENIADTTPKLAKLLRVRIVNYSLKTDPTHKQIGVIAQELEEISPGLIEETPDYAEVEIEPARTDVKTVQRQKVEPRADVRYETTLIDGQWRKLPVHTTVDVPLFQDHPLFDEAGVAVMEIAEPEQPEVLDADGQVMTPFKPAIYRQSTHRAPVMEDVQETVEVPAKRERQATGEVTKSVKYSVFVPMLIKAMQEQQVMIDALTQRLDALEAA